MTNHNPLDNSMWRSLVDQRPLAAERKSSPYSPFNDARAERLEYQAKRRQQDSALERGDTSPSPNSPFQNGKVEQFHQSIRRQHDVMAHAAHPSEEPHATSGPGEESST